MTMIKRLFYFSVIPHHLWVRCITMNYTWLYYGVNMGSIIILLNSVLITISQLFYFKLCLKVYLILHHCAFFSYVTYLLLKCLTQRKSFYFFSLRKLPKPNLLIIFFSMLQKNLCCPNKVPTTTKSTWYTISISIIFTVQKIIGLVNSGVIPIKLSVGLARETANDPFTANTINITIT